MIESTTYGRAVQACLRRIATSFAYKVQMVHISADSNQPHNLAWPATADGGAGHAPNGGGARKQRRTFVKKFRRESGNGDPIFFDPDADGLMPKGRPQSQSSACEDRGIEQNASKDALFNVRCGDQQLAWGISARGVEHMDLEMTVVK